MCSHEPPCPPADAIDHDAAHVIASFPQQGWSLLCNGIIVFDDTGMLLPDGRAIPPRRGRPPHRDAHEQRDRQAENTCQGSVIAQAAMREVKA
jgi:hypothetical protein